VNHLETRSLDSAASGSSSVADAIWSEMHDRAARGEAVRLEDYQTTPGLPLDDTQRMVDLIYGEYVLLKRLGGNPRVEDYLDRFPAFRTALVRQFEVHQELSSLGDASPDQTDVSPETIGKYRVIARLGRGGQGTVYRAAHPELEKDVVLKLSHSSLSSAQRESLRREGRVLAILQHPNLVPVLDLDFNHGRPFLVMAYVPGRTLKRYAETERPGASQACKLLAQVARGLAHAHDRGVVHRDIKPANILIDPDGMPHVIDFGVAATRPAWAEAEVEPAALSGTVAFMAPEQARAETAADPRSDLFSLGGVLYFLLTGQPLYGGTDFQKSLARARTGDWDRTPLQSLTLPQRLRNFCERALAVDPADRIPTAAAMADELERLARPPRRRVAPIAFAVAAVLLLLAVGFHFRQPSNVVEPVGTGLQFPALETRIRVWDGERYRALENSLPLTTGDELRIEVIGSSRKTSLFWRDSDGKVHFLGEGTGTWIYPVVEGHSISLEGRAGTEFIFAVITAGDPFTLDEMKAHLGSSNTWPQLPAQSLLRLDPDGVKVVQSGRGPGVIQRRGDPEGEVVRKLDSLRTTMSTRSAIIQGWAFSHQP
jgi:predicted Ser/Thr protein kinase